jgi:hypothetical protein
LSSYDVSNLKKEEEEDKGKKKKKKGNYNKV